MPILNYTTEVNAEKTIAEITKCLVAHGAMKIVTDYKDNKPSVVTFCLNVNGNIVGFALPCNPDGVLKAMKSDKNVGPKYHTRDQAVRVSWRIIKDWVEAQMAIVDAQLADMAEVFLPYAIQSNGETLYNRIKSTNMQLLSS